MISKIDENFADLDEEALKCTYEKKREIKKRPPEDDLSRHPITVIPALSFAAEILVNIYDNKIPVAGS
jgi:hypothetical protein